MRIIILLTFLVCSSSLLAQLKPLLREQFENPVVSWYQSTNETHAIKIKNGHYEFVTPENGWMSYLNINPIDDVDHSFEADFTQYEGAEDNGFGFFWGYDGEKLNNFVISSNGYVKVYSSDESRKDAKEWEKIDVIKPMGQTNHLKVESKSGMLYFYVNGTQVKKMRNLPWFKPVIGFVTYTKMRMQVDNFLLAADININLPADLPTGLVKENLGSFVNTAYNEVTPIISVDGKIIFFARKHAPENTGGVEDASDVWYSMYEGNQWGRAVNMESPINTTSVNNIAAISQDNNSMILATANDFELFEHTTNGWESKGTLGIYYTNENKYFEATMTADGKAILFAARNNKNVFYNQTDEERDLYVCLKDEKGKWSNPINLGKVVNSKADEGSPFMAADGKTMYFSSEGHPGYGGSDIFMARRLDNSWTKWSEPVNLGPEINTMGFDAYYTIPASGDYAYLCTSAGGYGESDIVRIKLPEAIRPDPVVLVRGKVLNAKTNKPIEADIVFENITLGKEVGEAISNPSSGDYRIALPYGTNYGIHAKAKGFLSVNENLELMSISTYTEIERNLLLVPIEVGEAIQLNNVFFEQGKPVLKPTSYPELDRLVQILKDNPSIEIELGGHTDNVGNPTGLQLLSQDRVATVKKYLVQQGVSASRITGKGYGASKPLVKNDTEEHRKMNRRVEFKIVKK